jgi:ABC-2 type transport system permease protein
VPIHSPGYRPWEGQRVAAAMRTGVIASTGVRRTSKSKWLRRMLFVSVLPTLFLSVPLFLFEQAARDPDSTGGAVANVLEDLPSGSPLAKAAAINLANASPEQVEFVRHQVWSFLLLTLFRYPQAVMMVLIIGIAAPPLISHDIRSRAFLIYFSKPITRWEYILGKMGTVAFFLAMITTLPALILYFAGVVLSPDLSVLFLTWDLPLRIALASIVLIVPTTSVALMFSSLTTESRYAGFGWFAIWILGSVSYSVLMAFAIATKGGRFDPNTDVGWQTLLSPYHTLGVVQSWIFDMHGKNAPIVLSIVLLVFVTVGSLAIVYRRVSLPMRA